MDKNTNLTNPAIAAVTTRLDGASLVKKPAAPAAGTPATPPLPNFAVLARRIFGNWPIIVAVAILGVPISFKLSKAKKLLYKSEGVISFRGGVNGDPTLESLKALNSRVKEAALAASTLKRVVDDLHLAPHATEVGEYDGIIASLRPHIDTKPKSADTFVISFDATTADEAQQITQRICEVIMEDNMKSRKDRAKDSIDFLESEKKRADDDLAKAEKARTLFMSQHPEFATDGKDGATIRAEQKMSTSQQKKAAGNALRVRRAAGASGSGVGPMPASAAGAPAVDPVLVATRNQARSDLLAARKQLADKSINLTEQHPDVRAAAARVAAAETTLDQAEAAIAAAQASAPAPVAATDPNPYDPPPGGPLAPPVDPLAKDAQAPHMKENGEPIAVEIEGEWSRINRDASEARGRSSQIEGRLFKAELDANSEVSGYGSQMIMPEPASRPMAPTGTNPQLLRAAGMGAAVVVGVLLAALRGILLDDRLFDASEVESLNLVPLLGSVPKTKGDKDKKKRGFLGRLRG